MEMDLGELGKVGRTSLLGRHRRRGRAARRSGSARCVGDRRRLQHRAVRRRRADRDQRRDHRPGLRRPPRARHDRGAGRARRRGRRRRDGSHGPHRRRARRHRGHGVGRRRRCDHRSSRSRSSSSAALVALWLAPQLFDCHRARVAVGGHARGARARVHAGVRRARRRSPSSPSSSARSSPGSRSGGRAQSERIRRELAPVGHLFIPVFFLADRHRRRRLELRQLDRAARRRRSCSSVAVVGKLRRGGRRRRHPSDRLLVGLGHASPRRGRPDLRHHRAPSRRARRRPVRRAPPRRARDDARHARAAAARYRAPPRARGGADADELRTRSNPPGGWIRSSTARSALAVPPAGRTARSSSRSTAAGRVGRARPVRGAARLVRRPAAATSLPWRSDDAARSSTCSRAATPRSWRFLDALDVLPRALPELADALRAPAGRRVRARPARLHRWETLERLGELRDHRRGERRMGRAHVPRTGADRRVPARRGRRPRRCGVVATQRLVERLGLGNAAEHEIALLVARARPHVRPGAPATTGSEERSSARGAPARPRDRPAAFLSRRCVPTTACSAGTAGRAARAGPAQLRATRWSAPEARDPRRPAPVGGRGSLVGLPATPVDRDGATRVRRVAAAGGDRAPRGAAGRVGGGGRHEVRSGYAAGPRTPAGGVVDVVAADRHGLLARVAGVLCDARLDVGAAVGGDMAGRPGASSLRDARGRHPTRPRAAATVVAAVDGPWSPTACAAPRSTSTTRRRPGTRSAGSAPPTQPGCWRDRGAFAAAGVDVHAAVGDDPAGRAADRFEVSRDTRLDAGARAVVRHNLEHGVELPGTPLRPADVVAERRPRCVGVSHPSGSRHRHDISTRLTVS